MSTVTEEWGLACPLCGRDDQLQITLTVVADLTPDGTDIEEGDHEWDDDSVCYCKNCSWEGKVINAKEWEEKNEANAGS